MLHTLYKHNNDGRPSHGLSVVRQTKTEPNTRNMIALEVGVVFLCCLAAYMCIENTSANEAWTILLLWCMSVSVHARQDQVQRTNPIYRPETDSGIVIGSMCCPLVFAAKLCSGGDSNTFNLFWLSCVCSAGCLVNLWLQGSPNFPTKGYLPVCVMGAWAAIIAGLPLLAPSLSANPGPWQLAFSVTLCLLLLCAVQAALVQVCIIFAYFFVDIRLNTRYINIFFPFHSFLSTKFRLP
jgi:hypothetical protein